MNKLKYLILFVVNTIIVASIYFFAANELGFSAIAMVYMIVSLAVICIYAYLCMHHNNEIAKAKLCGKEIDEETLSFRKRRLKLFIVFFFPFVLTFLMDCTYMFLIADNPLFNSIVNSLKVR